MSWCHHRLNRLVWSKYAWDRNIEIWSSYWPITFEIWNKVFEIGMPWLHWLFTRHWLPALSPPLEGSGNLCYSRITGMPLVAPQFFNILFTFNVVCFVVYHTWNPISTRLNSISVCGYDKNANNYQVSFPVESYRSHPSSLSHLELVPAETGKIVLL